MIILDTNVISAVMRQREPQIADWLNSLPSQSVWTTSVCVYEIEFGLKSLPKGKRRTQLEADFELALLEDLEGRILDFNALSAQHATEISARLKSAGRPVEIRDAMIAGTVAAWNATLATRNMKHFADAKIALVNPWEIQTD
ncbi:type II toxin-antitoxin system VapC family toxin [Thalassoglobus sp.]|uniref:type II toxin-antitoxin system VapC family toxin n=1 Tax=Thalassoglobus sp. TaxID=2795869 RepID=UPI003AA9021A